MIVVTAASGKLGRQFVRLEQVVGAANVRLVTRAPDSLTALAARGFEVVSADYDHRASLEAAFANASAVLLISSDAPNEPRLKQHCNVIDAAKRAGVDRVIYTAFVNPTQDSRFYFARSHLETETYLKNSELAWTILRNNQYCENLDGLLALAMKTGRLALPGAAGKVAYISRSDIAAATVTVLTQQGHDGQVYELTGSEALDIYEIAAALSKENQVEIEGSEADPNEFRAYLHGLGTHPHMVEALMTLYIAAEANEYADVREDAQVLARRPIGSMRDYVRKFSTA
jgi:NAD(P)H dehydrogenase (quinone)